MSRLGYAQVAIANGASLSGEIDMRSFRLVAIDMPAVWTAADISFTSCARTDNIPAEQPFDPVLDGAGAEVVVTAAQSTYIVLTSAQRQALAGLARTKFRSGVLAAPVNQGGARVLTLVYEPRDGNT